MKKSENRRMGYEYLRGGLLAYTALSCLIYMASCNTEKSERQNSMMPALGMDGRGNTAYNVMIINKSDIDVIFALRAEGGVWSNYALSAGERQAYSCVSCQGKFEVIIRTAEKQVQRELSAGRLYAIRPDLYDSVYDIYEM